MSHQETVYEALERVQLGWGLTNQQMAQLARVDSQTYARWMVEGRKSIHSPSIPEGMSTAMPVIAIYKALEKRFPNPEDQVKWLFQENKDFGNQKPIDIATSSAENLFWVSYYLDSSRDI